MPVLIGLYHIVPLSVDRVLIANGGRTVALSGHRFAERVGPLLAALDGTASRAELESRFPELASKVLAGLAANRLLTDAAPVPDTSVRTPQLTSLAIAEAGPPAEVSSRLAAATVAVAGCGAVGGNVATLLAKAGVGRLILGDERLVREPDVAVSAVLQASHEGRSRAEAVANLCTQTGMTAVETVASSAASVSSSEVVLAVIELGYDGEGAAAADVCLASRVPYLLHSQDALEASIGPLVTSDGDPCHHCLEARRLSHVTHLEEHEAYRQHRATTSPGPDAYLAAHSAILAGLVATEALRGLLDAGPLTHGALLVLSLGALTCQRELLHSVPLCAGCGGARDLG